MQPPYSKPLILPLLLLMQNAIVRFALARAIHVLSVISLCGKNARSFSYLLKIFAVFFPAYLDRSPSDGKPFKMI